MLPLLKSPLMDYSFMVEIMQSRMVMSFVSVWLERHTKLPLVTLTSMSNSPRSHPKLKSFFEVPRLGRFCVATSGALIYALPVCPLHTSFLNRRRTSKRLVPSFHMFMFCMPSFSVPLPLLCISFSVAFAHVRLVLTPYQVSCRR